MEMMWVLPPYDSLEGVLYRGGALLTSLLAAVLLERLLFWLSSGIARRTRQALALSVIERLHPPLRLLMPLIAAMLLVPVLKLPEPLYQNGEHMLSLFFIAGIAWVFANVTLAGRDHLLECCSQNDYKGRAIRTQLVVAVRVIIVLVVVIALAAMLMTFSRIRAVGMSILASAGLVGVTVGFAAQRSIATLFAGLQIAVTQPIRIDDVVLVEGEYGTIEEITLSYVVVKLWDLRRLVVPVTYFLEKPFQNWTRRSADLLGTVFLYADYSVPVERVRERLHEVLVASEKWDRRTWGVQVTSSTERSMELRVLLSAADAPSLWDLRCEVREKLLAYLREHYPESLPKARAELRVEQRGEAVAQNG